tara:strand:- start:1552 stop:2727 length:1176 start_codon:yes stop_codon:yes gene_type:complete
MAYFNHAYVKSAVISSTEANADVKTSALTTGELGLVDAADYETVAFPAANDAAVPAEYMLVFGNYNQTDTLGNNPVRGGYAESIKTKIIKPAYVTGLWKADCVTGTSQVIDITIPDDCFKCDGSTVDQNQLRIDIKGDEVLRYLNRFTYAVLDYRECCTSETTTVAGKTVTDVWAERINEDPLLNPFITATSTQVSGAGKLTLTVDYTATYFDNCSYDTRDHYGVAPLKVIVSPVDDDGNACTDTCMTADVATVRVQDFGKNAAVAVTTKSETTGERVIEEIILEGRYRQDGGWNQGNKDSARFRDIQHGDALLGCGTGAVDRTAFYAAYYLQHSVPRFNNPTGVFDNDQYMYIFYVPCIAGGKANEELDKMDFLWNSLANKSGLTVTDYL